MMVLEICYTINKKTCSDTARDRFENGILRVAGIENARVKGWLKREW